MYPINIIISRVRRMKKLKVNIDNGKIKKRVPPNMMQIVAKISFPELVLDL